MDLADAPGAETPLPDLKGALRARGLRVTAPRLLVLTWLAEHPHSTAAEVARALAADGAPLSTQGVYDVLAACTDVGLLRRICPADSPARYEARTQDDHHHLVCRSCGQIEDVDRATGPTPCLSTPCLPADGHGFVVDEAEVIFWGLCPACSTPPVPDAPSSKHRPDKERVRRV